MPVLESSTLFYGLILGVPTVLFFAGLLTGRWIVLLVPVPVWAFWGLAHKARWWGLTPGEALGKGTILLIAIGVASAAAGVLIHRLPIFGPSTYDRR